MNALGSWMRSHSTHLLLLRLLVINAALSAAMYVLAGGWGAMRGVSEVSGLDFMWGDYQAPGAPLAQIGCTHELLPVGSSGGAALRGWAI